MVIVINGNALTGKSKLAELVLKFMASKGKFDESNIKAVGAFPMDERWPQNLVGNHEAIIIEDLKDKYFA